MKKIILTLAFVTAAAFAFAEDKPAADNKSDKACCEKSDQPCCEKKADADKPCCEKPKDDQKAPDAKKA